MSRRLSRAALGVALVAVGLLVMAVPASGDSMTPISSFTDPRTDDPVRPACTYSPPDTCIKRGLYGPYTIPASSEIHNQPNFSAPAPCTNCYITDMVANLVDAGTGNPVNLAQDVMLHHFVLLNPPPQQDSVCPSGLQGQFGERFFAAGNERTHLHLPGPYGYYNPAGATTWRMFVHVVNKSTTLSKSVNIEIIYRYRQTGLAASPLWLDIDGCGDSEYTAPLGYSDTHADWTSDMDGRFIGLSGHLHDVDITNLQLCTNSTDDDGDGRANDGCPALAAAETQCTDTTDNDGDGRVNDGCAAVGAVEGPCADHCAAKGHGIATSVELVGGPPGDYYGPIPPNRAPPADLTGATICRSEGYYGTPWAVNEWRKHLDTMSLCGIFHELPAGHQSEPYPPDGEFPIDGYPLKPNQVVRLHSEYQNDTGAPQADVMGIVMGWVAQTTPGYARPKAASPSTVKFVPAHNACTSGTANHGAPLARPSCSPPVQTSNHLTVGSPESNGLPAASVGTAALKVLGEGPIDPTNGDQADVQVTGQFTDVRRKSNPAQTYTGEVQFSTTVRITDRFNVGGDPATVQDVPFTYTAACTNGTCNLATTFDAALANVIKEGKRSIWQLGQVKIFDGGADGVVSTAGNSLFAVQGLFAP